MFTVQKSVEVATLYGNSGYARVGMITLNNKLMETPNTFNYTKFGAIPHVTTEQHKHLEGVHVCLDHIFGAYSQKSLTKLAEHATLVKHLALEDYISFASFRDVARTQPSSNGLDKGMSLNNSSGIKKISIQDYHSLIDNSGFDIVTSMADFVVELNPSLKRIRKSIDRTNLFLKETIEHRENQDNSNLEPALFAILQGSLNKEERARCIEDINDYFNDKIDGYVIEGFGVGEDDNTRDEILSLSISLLDPLKPRVLHGVNSINDVFQAISNGVDIIDSSYPLKLTEQGYALTLPFAADSKNIDSSLLLNLWSTTNTRSKLPIVVSCDCFTCQNHSRAYIHHLLNTHEILALTLLMLHNLRSFQILLKEIRKSILNDSFDELRKQVLKEI